MFNPFTILALVAASVSASSAVQRRDGGVTGDSQCGDGLCVSATVNGSTVEYVLTYSYPKQLGWLAMGFGTEMAGSSMVIMWPNSDGSVTLSQRKATSESLPTLDQAPARVAAFSTAISNIVATKPQYGYTIPANTDTKQSIIWAYGTDTPSSPAVDATFQQHVNMGGLTLDLTKPISTSSTGSNTTTPTSSSSSSSQPYTSQEKIILAHGILASIGFLLFLPAGVLLARYMRTRINSWFQGHWIIQFAISGPLIIIGIILGFAASANSGSPILDTHKKTGIVLLVLYLAQCALGAFIHFVKPAVVLRRPPQNYSHAVLGLVTIGLAFWQVHTGYKEEWPDYVGRGPAPAGVNVVWYIWVIIIPLAYFSGLALLKKQYRQEAENRSKRNEFSMENF